MRQRELCQTLQAADAGNLRSVVRMLAGLTLTSEDRQLWLERFQAFFDVKSIKKAVLKRLKKP